MKKSVLIFLLFFIANSFIAQTENTLKLNELKSDTLKVLEPEARHQKSDLLIMTLLTRYHYKKAEINDSLSSVVLDRYLETLDYNRSYFLVSDIENFEKYRYQLDDYLKIGKLNPAYDVFNVYVKRLIERNNYIKDLLARGFDFTEDEFYEPDRKKAEWAKTNDELNEIWRKRLKNEAIFEMLKDKNWDETAETLRKRYSNFNTRMLQTKSEDVFQYFMNSFSQSIDPHTNYFSPETSENFKISMSLSLEGIGAQLRSEDEYTKVAEIIHGGPAYKSGLLHKNDKIVGVAQGEDGEMVDVIGWRLDEVVKLIRGPKGTTVRLQIIVANDGSFPKEIKIVREKVKLEEQAAKKEIIEINQDGVPFRLGVITLPAFYFDFEAMQRGDKDYKSTTRDIRKLLKELKEEKVDGLIMDLRNNGGGSLQEAIELTGLFIKDGPVVQVRNSDGTIDVGDDPDSEIIYDGPLAVLVNKFSASASEIFAGAIQDYQRGLVIGEQTYGKGTVQNLIDLNRFNPGQPDEYGQLKLTIAKYYRIDGGSTQNKGVIPDVEFPSAIDPKEFGESSEPSALPWDQIQSAQYNTYEQLKSLIPSLIEKHNERVNKNPEFKKLVDDIEEYKEERKKKSLSLNLEKRKQEKAESENKNINSIENTADLETSAITEIPAAKSALEDPLLKETASILSDMILLSVR